MAASVNSALGDPDPESPRPESPSAESPSPESPSAESPSPESLGRSILIRRLSERAASRAELRDALERKHIEEQVAERLLDGFEASGLINDEQFARQWVESRQRSKGIARSVLAMELRRKGIDELLAQQVLAEIDPEAERAAAHRLVRKKLRTMDGLSDTVQIRRLTAALARKGYAPQVAFDVVRTELADQGGAPDHVLTPSW